MSEEISQGLSGTDSDNTPVGESNSSEVSESLELTFAENYPDLGDKSEKDQSGTAEGNASKSGHPAWQEYLEEIPEVFRPQVTPAFEKWDKEAQDRIQKVQSKYAPYEKFTQHQPEELDAAMQLVHALRTNPKGVYDDMARRFGFSANVDQGQSDKDDDSFDPFGDDSEEKKNDSIENHPQFQALQQQVAQFQQAFQQQQEAQQAARVEAQVKQETEQAFSQIERTIGKPLNEIEKKEILRRTVLIGDQTGNYDVIEGYRDFAQFANQLRNQPRANDTAPAVLSGNGGMPVKSQDMSIDEKFDHWTKQLMGQVGKQ